MTGLYEIAAWVTVFEMQDDSSLVKEKSVKDVLMFCLHIQLHLEKHFSQILKPVASFVPCFAQASTESRS